MTSDTEPRKSSILTDEDYKSAKVWNFNQTSIARNLREQGGIYEGLLEGTQNGIDAPENPETDYNRIDITIPLLGDRDYKTVVASIRDIGGSVTKDTNGDILEFINQEKAISPKAIKKGVRRYGEGMVQYGAVSSTQLLISQDREYIYRIPILLNNDGRPAYGKWSFHKITPETQAKYNIFHMGTLLLFLDPYEDMVDLDPMKLGRMIRQTFGWRLLLQPNTEIWINETIKIDLPDYLKDKKVGFICRLKKAEITESNGQRRKVNPEVTGFIFGDPKGKGTLHVHAGGYYIGEMKFADKRFSGAINIDEMPTDPSRRIMIHEGMKQDLENHIIEQTKHFPDIPMDNEEIGEKKHRSMTDLLNKILEQFNIPKLQIESYEAEKRKRIETFGDPNADEFPGYRKPKERSTEEKPEELEMCDLCGHLKKKSKRIRKKCDCKCHLPREKGPDKEVATAGTDGDISIMVEEQEIEKTRKRSELALNFNPNAEPEDKFVELRSGYVGVNMNNPLFNPLVVKEKNITKAIQNLLPFIASEIMDLKHPDALSTMPLDVFRKTQEEYTIKMMEVI